MTRLSIHSSPEETAGALASRIVDRLAAALQERDHAHLVLTGGRMGIQTLASLAGLAEAHQLDWGRVHIWWGDERWVLPDSPERNDLQARQALLDILPLSPANIHPMPASDCGLTLDDAALLYGRELASIDPTEPTPLFDVLLLGIGPDGHIASLFPGFAQVYDTAVGAVPVYDSPKPPPERISLTLPAINRARNIYFVAAGTDKATAVHLALRGLWYVDLPASGAKGTDDTVWFLDRDAAGELDTDFIDEIGS